MLVIVVCNFCTSHWNLENASGSNMIVVCVDFADERMKFKDKVKEMKTVR